MTSRITSSMMTRSVLADLNDIATKQDTTRRQMSSGKQITRPSDDPYGTARAMSLRTDLARIKQNERNVTEAQSWMSVTDTTLGSIGDLASKTKELLIQGATDTLPQTSRDAIADHIPAANGRIAAAKTCLYTVTPDGDFIIDRMPGAPDIIVVSPCSGHGFKFAPVIGEIVADLVVDGATRRDIERFPLKRFG